MKKHINWRVGLVAVWLWHSVNNSIYKMRVYFRNLSVQSKIVSLGERCVIGKGKIYGGKPKNNKGIIIGDDVLIYDGYKLVTDAYIVDSGIILGRRIAINYNSYINGTGGVEIGDNVIIGPNVQIISAGHEYASLDKPIRDQGMTFGKIIIENDVWIGGGTTILQGVVIGRGSVIGAATVITKDIPPMSVVVGNPAKVIKKRQ